jgi:predicted small lipoprotein YifL
MHARAALRLRTLVAPMILTFGLAGCGDMDSGPMIPAPTAESSAKEAKPAATDPGDDDKDRSRKRGRNRRR